MPLPTQTVPADAQAPAWRGLLVTGAGLLGVAALLFGLLEHGVALHERRQLLVLVVAGTVAAVALSWAVRQSWRLVVLVVLAALVTMFGLGAVAMLLVTGATTLALGILAFGAPARPLALALALRSASGLAIMVAVLQPMMHLRVNFAPVYLGLSALALAAVHRDLARLAKDSWFALAARPAPGPGRATAVLLLAALLLATLHAAMPESGYDALSNHLIIVRWVDWHGYWHFDPAVFDRALTPRGVGWLFAWAHVLGGEPAMKLLNAAAFWLTAGIVLAHTAADPEPPPPWLAPFGLLALAVTPLTVWVMAMLFEETVTTLFVTAALASLAVACRSPEDRAPALMTFLLLGAACAAKVQALFFGGIGILAVLGLFRGGRRVAAALALALAGCLLFAVVGLVPYAQALLVTGNPFFPFSAGEPPDARWIGMLGPDVLYRMTFRTAAFMETRDFAFGFQHLVLIPTLLAGGLLSRRGDMRAIAAALLLFGAMMLSQTQYARYLFYGMPGLLLLLAPAWALLGGATRRAPGRALLAVGLGLAIVLNVLAYRAIYTPSVRPWTLLQPERFARGVPEERRVIAAINATHGETASVYFAGLPFTAGLSGRAFSVYTPLRYAIDRSRTPEEVETLLRANNITHVVTATPANMNAAPALIPPALESLLATRLVEVPTVLNQVRIYALPQRRPNGP